MLSHRDTVLGVAVSDSSRLFMDPHLGQPLQEGAVVPWGGAGGLVDAAGQGVAQIHEVLV